ncbi:MAG TPA: DUF6427 family protein, partial [Chitinophagaceae bacterium]|nr:DUF6427 family protein [Chitinophagaceae bacterium]
MVGLFKRNDIVAFAGLLILHILLQLKGIMNPVPVKWLDKFYHGFFFQWNGLERAYSSHPGVYMVVSAIMFFVFALYVNLVVNQERLYARKSYIPALSLILFSAFTPEMCLFSSVFVANVLIFIAFARTLMLYSHNKPRKACFDIGLLVGLASLFYFPAVLLVILFILMFAILRSIVLQEFVAFLVGVIGTWYFAAAYVFIRGDWKIVLQRIYFHIHLPSKLIHPSVFIISSVVSILLLVYGMFLLNLHGPKNPIAVRKKWNAVVFYAFFGLVIGLFSSIFPSLPWLLAVTPFSIILSQTFQHNREKINIFTFY